MLEKKEGTPWRWLGLLAVACLLAVCMLLLGGQLVHAAPLEAGAPEEQAPANEAGDSGAGIRSPAATLEISVNYAHDWVAGITDAGATVVVTVTTNTGELKADAVVTADGATGDFFVACEDWFSGWCEDIVPGDRVLVYSTGLLNEISPVGSITGQVDEVAETVTGRLDADWLADPVDVSCEVWEEEGPVIYATANPDGGSFSCDFSGQWDLQRGDQVALRYYEPDGDSVINMLVWPSMRVNYAEDWVGGDYPAGHTIAITVTDSLGWEKATASAASVVSGGWAGEGFETQEMDWSPTAPDLVPGDWVFFAADDGYTKTMEVGTLSASVDAAADSVGGQVFAPFGVTLQVECYPWGAWESGTGDAPVKQSSAEPNGSVPFLCQWDPATEWDVQPGQRIAVMYVEPDGDRVIDVVEEPAPHVRIEKSAASAPAEGGNLRFDIQLWNEGSAPADAVIVTDLMEGLEYLSDTSGLTPSGTGSGPITWMFGTLNPSIPVEFTLFANVTASISETITNTVTIATSSASNQGEPWERESIWSSHVEPIDLSLSVDKWAWTDQPAPDQNVVFALNVCNEGSTASGEITLTDRLHPALSLEDLWSYEPGWHTVSESPDELVVALPSLDSGSCSEYYVELHLAPDAQPGDPITNTAEIAAAFDPPDGNLALWESQVGEPHLNVWIDKGWSDGQLVPGGQIRYHISYGNDGNLAAGPLWITDTFPVSTTFVSAWYNDPWGGFPLVPNALDAHRAVWEIAELGNGQSGDFVVTFDVDPGATPGTVLLNRAEISPLPEETQWGDNTAEWTETLYGPAPNLRVQKGQDWNGDGQLNYHLHFENVGSVPVSSVWITDLLPLDTYWDGWWDLEFDWARLVTWDYVDATRTFLWELDQLGPGESGWIHLNANLDEPGAPLRWYTNTVDITIPDGDPNPDDNHAETLAFSGGEVRRVEFWLNELGPSSMWGEAVPGVPLTVTTPYSTVTTYVGNSECESCWRFDSVGRLKPGDAVAVQAGSGLLPVELVVPKPFDVSVDTGADQVSGRIDNLNAHLIEIHGNWDGGYQEVQTDSKGNLLAQYDDIPRGADGYVRFEDEVSYAWIVWHRPFRAMDLILEVNYGHDWVQGYYEPDHTIWITVTGSDGVTPKGTAELLSQEVPEWGGFVGFSTSLGDAWDGQAPDLQPDDWVYGRVDNGYTSEVQVGDITGVIDVTAETVAGTVTAPWPAGTILDAWCSVSVENGPGQDFPVDAAGGAYSCDFSGQWDLQPGQDVAVGYHEPDQDQVINVFREPAPDLNVSKEVVGNGDVQYNGLSVFRIGLYNEGDADAIPVILTDTLPAGMSYVANSSGVEPVPGAGNTLVWTFDSLGWAEGIDLWLVVANDLGIDQTVVNQVDVWTEFDSDPGDNHAEAEVQAVDNPGADLGIGKNPQPNDPAPGQTFLYEIDYGNNGPAATGPVTLVDTLPEGTSIDGWYSENGYELWTDASTADQLILEAPALPGNWGDRIILRLLVDPLVEVGTQLTNTVEIESPDGSALDMRDDVWVGGERWEGSVDKRLGWGTLVPDGVMVYNVHVRNQGNMTAGFTLTDTLPGGTSFWQVWRGDHLGWVEIEPAYVDDEILVVNVGELKPAEFLDFEVRLHIDPDLLPGSELENCVEINAVGPGDWPEDNRSCATDTVRPEGPNVRLQKDYQWNGESQLQYNLTFWNLGTETLYDLEIIDTLPVGTHWIGDDQWWHNFWEDIDVRVEGNQVIFTVSWLDPTWGSNISFNVDLDEPWTEGTAYTNSALMPLEGDVFPDDNYDEVTAYTGPDLYVQKELDSGEPRPGALLSYTIEFGNQNVWPWDSDWLGDEEPSTLIVDLLPEGMTFITATAPWNPQEGWMPDIAGQELSWGFGPINAGESWKFQLVAQVSPSAESGDILTNTVEVLSLSPGDIDPLPDDNSDQVVLEVLAPALTIEKEVSTSGVAGTIAGYTLSVQNLGNVPATGVTFADTLPDDLTYVDSDGTWDGTDITWSAGELAAFGGTAGGWFSATLTCEAGALVANDTYSVTSNEGATATGATVAVTTIAPTLQLSLASAPDPAFTGETVTLTATASTDGTGLAFEWDFGDGPVSGGLVETNVWQTAGSYTVVVTATDQCGYTETASTIVNVGTGLTIGKEWTSSRVAGTLVTYTLAVENVGNELATGVTFADTLPDDLTYVDSDGAWDGTTITWSAGDLAAGGGTAAGWFSATLTCEAGVQVVNDTYSVISDLGATTVGAPVALTTLAPAIQLSLASAPDPGIVDETVTLTVTAVTNGTGLSFEWDFGDGPVSGGLVETQVWETAGSYTVVVTATDQCGYSETASTVVTVEPGTFYIYLPLMLRQYP